MAAVGALVPCCELGEDLGSGQTGVVIGAAQQSKACPLQAGQSVENRIDQHGSPKVVGGGQ